MKPLEETSLELHFMDVYITKIDIGYIAFPYIDRRKQKHSLMC